MLSATITSLNDHSIHMVMTSAQFTIVWLTVHISRAYELLSFRSCVDQFSSGALVFLVTILLGFERDVVRLPQERLFILTFYSSRCCDLRDGQHDTCARRDHRCLGKRLLLLLFLRAALGSLCSPVTEGWHSPSLFWVQSSEIDTRDFVSEVGETEMHGNTSDSLLKQALAISFVHVLGPTPQSTVTLEPNPNHKSVRLLSRQHQS